MCGNENRDAFEGEKATAWHVQQIEETAATFTSLVLNPL
jgi:hypothetical protein